MGDRTPPPNPRNLRPLPLRRQRRRRMQTPPPTERDRFGTPPSVRASRRGSRNRENRTVRQRERPPAQTPERNVINNISSRQNGNGQSRTRSNVRRRLDDQFTNAERNERNRRNNIQHRNYHDHNVRREDRPDYVPPKTNGRHSEGVQPKLKF